MNKPDITEERHQMPRLPELAPVSDLIVLQIKEFRTRIGSVLNDVEIGGKYLIQAHKKALAIIQPFDPAIHRQTVRVTRGSFAKESSRYLNRARQGELFGIFRTSECERDPRIVIERPPEDMLREPTVEDRRRADRDRKRKFRQSKRDKNREKRKKERIAHLEQNLKLKAIEGLSLVEVREAVRLLKATQNNV